MKVVVMSIKPQYSRRIFDGEKRFELRRTPIKVDAGDIVVVYESSPSKAIVGAFVVEGVRRGAVQGLWRRLRKELGVSPREYREYFDGAELAHAIEVGTAVEVTPVPLDELREQPGGFRPPQSYMFWRDGANGLVGEVAAQAAGSLE